MANLTNIYSDIDLKFSPQPSTGDISLVLDNRAVIASVRNLLLTNFYDRPWQPSLGSNMSQLLFENVDNLMETTIAQEIKNVIKNFEPRVNLIDVTVIASDENNSIYISVVFKIVNTERPITLDFILERTR